MKPNAAQLRDLKDEIADILESYIRRIFSQQANYKFTFIARVDGQESMDILITEDSIDEIENLLRRSSCRKEIR